MRMLGGMLATLLCLSAAGAAELDQPVPLPAPIPPAHAPLPEPEAAGPPPLPQPAAVAYFVGEDGQPVGPLTLAEVQQRIREGKTKREDLVWKKGLPNWAAAESFAELQPAFQDTLPPPMPPEASIKQALIGTWEATTDLQGYLNTVRISFAADGRYSGTTIMTPPGSQPMQAPLVGTWTIQTTGADTFVLKLKDANGAEASFTQRLVDAGTLENLANGVRSHKIGM